MDAAGRPSNDHHRKYAGCRGTVKSNLYQKTADYPGEWASEPLVMLDSEELLTVRWDQVEALTRRV